MWLTEGGQGSGGEGFPFPSGLRRQKGSGVVRPVSSEISLTWFKSWLLLSDSQSVSFLFFFFSFIEV